MKLIGMNFIYPMEYAEWLASIVLVMKKNGKIYIYRDYQYLNKETLKDPFKLPNKDTLLDDMEDKDMYSFIDRFLGYN